MNSLVGNNYPEMSGVISLAMHCLISHLGLGDAIIQAGMAVVLSKRYGKIAFPCYPLYLASVRSFFVNEPDVHVYPVEHRKGFDWGSPPAWAYDKAIADAGIETTPEEHIPLGVFRGALSTDFTKDFYAGSGVQYDHRWQSCPIPTASLNVPQLSWTTPYADNVFLHDDPARNFRITRLNHGLTYRPESSESDTSILQYATLLQTAKAVAVIDSCMFHLAECFPLFGRAEMHAYARWPRPRDFRYETRNKWDYLF